jgi:hypothetical protein
MNKYYAENNNLLGTFKIVKASTGETVRTLEYKDYNGFYRTAKDAMQELIKEYNIKTIY